MFSRSGSYWYHIRWTHLLSDVSWRNDLNMAWFSLITFSNHSLWIGWLRVILPAIHSLRAKALTSGWVTKLASLTKKLRFPTQPVWSRMQGLSMLKTQIEVRISLKNIWAVLISLCPLNVYGYIFNIVLPLCYQANLREPINLFFLVTSTTAEIGRHDFKGLGNVMSPLSHKVSRIRN